MGEEPGTGGSEGGEDRGTPGGGVGRVRVGQVEGGESRGGSPRDARGRQRAGAHAGRGRSRGARETRGHPSATTARRRGDPVRVQVRGQEGTEETHLRTPRQLPDIVSE